MHSSKQQPNQCAIFCYKLLFYVMIIVCIKQVIGSEMVHFLHSVLSRNLSL